MDHLPSYVTVTGFNRFAVEVWVLRDKDISEFVFLMMLVARMGYFLLRFIIGNLRHTSLGGDLGFLP